METVEIILFHVTDMTENIEHTMTFTLYSCRYVWSPQLLRQFGSIVVEFMGVIRNIIARF
jgi:hypothetical protein